MTYFFEINGHAFAVKNLESMKYGTAIFVTELYPNRRHIMKRGMLVTTAKEYEILIREWSK